MKKLCLLLLLPFLANCSSNSVSRSAALPTLSSPALAKSWGAPSIKKTANGYKKTYTNPSNSKEKLRIIGSSNLMSLMVYPPNIKGPGVSQPQLWTKVLVLGKTVKMYQSTFPNSEKYAEYRTLGKTLKDQSGRSGQYRFEMEGSKKQAQSWLTEIRFE